MTETVTVPRDVYNSLSALAVAGSADKLLQMLQRDARTGQRLVHPGDSFGRVVAWVWREDRARAVLLLADYLAELREHHRLAHQIDPPVTLDEVLWGLEMAWPPDAKADYAAVPDYVRDHIAAYYGSAV